jgi:hypothetical protein
MRIPWRDAGSWATAILAAAAVAGSVGVFAAWRGAAALDAVWLQVPWLVSGGIGGLALIGLGLGLLDVHLERRREAVDRVERDAVLREAELFAERLLARTDTPRRRPKPRRGRTSKARTRR